MAKKQTMDAGELETRVAALKRQAMGAEDSELSADREKALDYYYGRPFGNETEGRSGVVDKVLMDVVEWVMPQIMRVFGSTDELARFEPMGPEDEALAEQESDYTNIVLLRENPGFLIFHDAIKDGLLLRNGYVKSWWEEADKVQVERYKGLTEMGLTSLITSLEEEDAEVEVLGKDERSIDVAQPDGSLVPETVWDCKLRVRRKVGRVRVEAVPAEEVLVSQRTRGSLQDTDFVAHWTTKTRSELLELGMSREFVESVPAFTRPLIKEDKLARNILTSETERQESMDTSMEEVDYLEAYVRVDFDGDGKAELRRVVLCGDKLPPGEEWNEEIEEIPFSYGVPMRMPHRHLGISYYDLVGDFQLIKSTLERNLLDNVYLTNHQRPIFNERVNQSDVLLSAPGAGIRVEGTAEVQSAFQFWAPNPVMNQIMPVLDYFEQRKEHRTGVGPNNTVMDPNVLRDSARETVRMAQNAANQRVEMVVRMFAETLVKDVIIRVHNLLIRHQDKARLVRMRNQWVEVDPREWVERDDVQVAVGLGMGSAEETRNNLMMMAGIQEKAALAGIVLPKNVYALGNDMAKSLGFKQAGKYLSDPESPEFQQMMANRPPPKDPLVAAKEVETQGKVATEQMGHQAEAPFKAKELQIKEYEAVTKRMQLQADIAVKSRPAPAPDPSEQQFKQREMGMREFELQSKARELELTLGPQFQKASAEAEVIRAQAASQEMQSAAIAEQTAAIGAVVQNIGQLAAQMGQAFMLVSQGQQVIAEGQKELVKGQEKLVEAVAAPKKIEFQRENGKIVGAEVQVNS